MAGTRAQTFFLGTVDLTSTFTGAADVRSFVETVGGSSNTTIASFGTASAEIVLDPFTSRSTTGTTAAPDYGWALLQADSATVPTMFVPSPPAGVDDAVRFIAAGTWTFNARLGVAVAATSTYTVTARVYRVASDDTRTLLFSATSSGSTVVSSGTDFTWTSSQPEYTFGSGESLLWSLSITKTNTSVSAEAIQLRVNDTLGVDTSIVLPAGIRTRFLDTETFAGVGTAVRQAIAAAHSVTSSAVGTATVARQVSASKQVAVAAVGTATATKNVTLNTITTTAVGTVSGRIELPLDEVPDLDVGDLPGTDAAIAGTVFTTSSVPASGATVILFRQSDNQYISQTTTDGAGRYRFDRNAADAATYFVVAFTVDDDGGMSRRSLTVVPD